MRPLRPLLAALLAVRLGTCLAYPAADDVARADTAIVFGAGVRPDGSPSAVLRERVDAAARLWRAGRVDRLLLSGGPGEPEAMRRAARADGVPEGALVLDAGGVRTIETCRRARGLGSAVLVTQSFHLPRALLLCNGLGVPSVGVAADGAGFRVGAWGELREVISTTVAWAELARK
jgi:vancomycin permeability regulator SanA